MLISFIVGGLSFSGSVIVLIDIWFKKWFFLFGVKEYCVLIIYCKLVV